MIRWVINVLILLCFLSGLSLVLPSEAQAARSFLLANKKGKRALGFSIDVGASYNFNYSRFRSILTSPNFLLAEGHLTIWYKNSIGIYGVFGVSMEPFGQIPMIYGGGLKLPLVNLVGSKTGLINGISIRLLADYIFFTFPASTDPTSIYLTSGAVVRYGGSIEWGLFHSSLFLDTTVLITRYSEQLFLGPYVGLGFQF
ncbi:MAG: hypothetical protein HYX41_03255 [Bdellovibrio sp.]|nr:hypothetical protein [Bdellovibrio sp.]